MSLFIKRFLLVFFVFFSACGYRLQGSGSVLPNDIKTISIKPVENTTTLSGLGPRLILHDVDRCRVRTGHGRDVVGSGRSNADDRQFNQPKSQAANVFIKVQTDPTLIGDRLPKRFIIRCFAGHHFTNSRQRTGLRERRVRRLT